MIGRRRVSGVALACLLVVSGCGGSSLTSSEVTPNPAAAAVQTQYGDVAMARPGPFDRRTNSADILVQSQSPIPAEVLERIRRTKGVEASEQFSMATFYAEESAVTYAAVNPDTFRSFTYGATAALNEVWDRIADGEIALRTDLRESLATSDDFIQLGNDDNAKRAHVGAYAPLIERSKIGAVLNERWATTLGMPEGNAVLVSTGTGTPQPVIKKLRKALGKGLTVTLLAPNVDPNQALTAVLTGGSVAQAVGSFTYTANADGTVNPDPSWVREYIRTATVPILGSVTCNKAMLPQLELALRKIQRAGLGSKINPGEYGGCYVPRFIARDPSKGLSFHTFGTALDLNVPGNLRGTVGEIDRRVVNIFIQCGFSWGGTWRYTDPMHFELARITSC